MAVLEESREWGFLGPGSLEAQIEHSLGFARGTEPPRDAVDLGSGGGIPGLVLARKWPQSRWLLLDSSERRTEFLTDAVARLGWEDRVRVLRSRAEDAGRDPDLRAGADLVVARSFAAPGPTAECAAPFLRAGGTLLVSEPPQDNEGRWPEAVNQLGLRFVETRPGPPHIAVLVQDVECPAAYPRPSGRPAKRPLF